MNTKTDANEGSAALHCYPSWWPDNPYPADIFPMTTDDYVQSVPDENERTALSGCLGRLFWDIASKSIRDAWLNSEDEPKRLRKALRAVLTSTTLDEAKAAARVEIERHVDG